MRTKTLILSALCGLMGSAAAMAQVYSLNAVGYVNMTFPANKFVMFSNPLNQTNTLQNLFGTAPSMGTTLYKWTGSTYKIVQYFGSADGWQDENGPAGDVTMNPGEGAFMLGGDTAFTNTFVGTVLTGDLSNSFGKNFTMFGSKVPQAGSVTALGLTKSLVDGDAIYKWNGSTWVIFTKMTDPSLPSGFMDEEGNDALPSLNVGEAIFLLSQNGGAWTRTFDINK